MTTVRRTKTFAGATAEFIRFAMVTGVLLAIEASTEAQLARRVSDINPATSAADSNPSWFTEFQGVAFFVANDGANGRELWGTDATAAGTRLFKDVVMFKDAFVADRSPEFTRVRDELFFVVFANSGLGRHQLWKTDGTPQGTQLVKGFDSFSDISPNSLTDVNGTLFFVTGDPVAFGAALWKSDGTEAGTLLVKRFEDFPRPPHSLTNVNGTLFFSANSDTGEELWKSDGTEAGTVLVKDIFPGSDASSPAGLTNLDGTLFFAANDGASGEELWKSNGTAEGTVRVKDINGAGWSFPESFVKVDGLLFFSATDGLSGFELWKSDGTEAGTTRVKDINHGLASSNPFQLTNANGVLFFSAFSPGLGIELWKSDGTEAGTLLVRDVAPGAASSFPSPVVSAGDLVFFAATDPASGRELWKSSGTAEGTMRVKDIVPGAASSSPFQLAGYAGSVLFSAAEPSTGRELWSSDGTEAGTTRLKDINPGAGSSTPQALVGINESVFFSALEPATGRELWKSNGTLGGSVQVKDIRPGASSAIAVVDGYGTPNRLIDLNGELFFAANDGVSGTELWRSDGSAGGTVQLKDVRPGLLSSSPSELVVHDGTLYFGAFTDTSGFELWKSDGTEGGTVLVKDIRPGSGSSSPRLFTSVDGTLFFFASTPAAGYELWKTDGTESGTVLVKDIRPGPASSVGFFHFSLAPLASFNGALLFTANDGSNGEELWKSDGTALGTVAVKDIYPGPLGSFPIEPTIINGEVFFSASDPDGGRELWKSDGTEAGTVRVKDINPGVASSLLGLGNQLAVCDDLLIFAAVDATSGQELWKSDGTDAGTVRLRDIEPESGWGIPEFGSPPIITVGKTCFLRASDGVRGAELWKTDGTVKGTVLLQDIAVGAGSSDPDLFTPAGSRVFFTANDNSTGRELWEIPEFAGGLNQRPAEVLSNRFRGFNPLRGARGARLRGLQNVERWADLPPLELDVYERDF